MTLPKFSIGVHAPSFQTGADGNTYNAGELATYLAALGLADAGGAIAHCKLNDSNGLWSLGQIPAVSASNQLFLSEAKALGFTTLLAWQTGPDGSQPWTAAGQAELADFDTAAALVAAVANVDILLYGNEREVDDVTNGSDEAALYYDLENRCGQIWQAAGKAWAVGADEATANFLGSIEAREATWDSEPDYLALHMYGQGGTVANHLALVRDAIEFRLDRSIPIIVSEWAVAFEGLSSWNTKPQVRDYRARDYAEWFGRALRRERIYGCYFTHKELNADPAAYPGRMPRQGLIDALSDAPVNDEPPSSTPLNSAARTYRYLIEGRSKSRHWNAIRAGLAERARSLVNYASYWGA